MFDPEMMAGLKALSEMKPEDLTPEQREAIAKAVEAIDKLAETAKEAGCL